MSDYNYDLFVIGAGSGGVRAARFSANSTAECRLYSKKVICLCFSF